MTHQKCSHPCTWKPVKMSLYRGKKIPRQDIIPKTTGTKKLEELIFLILAAEHNFLTNSRQMPEGSLSFRKYQQVYTLCYVVFFSACSQICPLLSVSSVENTFFAQHLLLSVFLGLTRSIRQGHLDNSPAFLIAIVRAFQMIFSASRVVQAIALEKTLAKLNFKGC